MRSDMCKKCGSEMIEFHRCVICSNVCKFICPRCIFVSEDQVHLECINQIKKPEITVA